jgi:hypothetical protein
VATAMLCKEQGITITGICAIYEIFLAQKVSNKGKFFITFATTESSSKTQLSLLTIQIYILLQDYKTRKALLHRSFIIRMPNALLPHFLLNLIFPFPLPTNRKKVKARKLPGINLSHINIAGNRSETESAFRQTSFSTRLNLFFLCLAFAFIPCGVTFVVRCRLSQRSRHST